MAERTGFGWAMSAMLGEPRLLAALVLAWFVGVLTFALGVVTDDRLTANLGAVGMFGVPLIPLVVAILYEVRSRLEGPSRG